GRRRHTRSTRDWSSDVCSSDLLLGGILLATGCAMYSRHGLEAARAAAIEKHFGLRTYALTPAVEDEILALDPEHVTEADLRGPRSEERRVGQECTAGGCAHRRQ